VYRIRIVSVTMLAAVVVGVGLAVGSSSAASRAARVAPTTVNVKATEFHFALSAKSIATPGIVIFKIKNAGKEPHNFVVLSGINKTTALILPGTTGSLKITFKKKGSYTYECTVGEHAAEGMFGKFTVK
jgi:plastocyanin